MVPLRQNFYSGEASLRVRLPEIAEPADGGCAVEMRPRDGAESGAAGDQGSKAAQLAGVGVISVSKLKSMIKLNQVWIGGGRN